MVWQDAIIKIVFIGGGSLLGMGVIAGLFFFFTKKKSKGKQILFLLYSLGDLSRPAVIKGYITNQENNKAQKEFYLPDYKQYLGIRKPNFYVGKQSYRQITMNERGELDYLNNRTIENNNVVQQLSPEEKQILVNRLRMNTERYQDPLNKYTMMTLIGTLIMAFFIVAAVGYTAYAQGKAASVHAASSESLLLATKSLERTAKTLYDVGVLMTLVSADLRGTNSNFTRVIS